MNYLAHCYLSCSDEDILIGNFMTDFIKKKEEQDYSGRIKDGITLHRKIDTFTDAHPASLELRALLRKRHGKYAPVVVDLIWDHLLSIHWSRYSGSDLRTFTQDVYGILSRNKEVLPIKLKGRIDKMISSDFLLAYANKENMLKSLQWMDNRVKYPSAFHQAIDDLEENESVITELFYQFFPDLIAEAELHCAC